MGAERAFGRQPNAGPRFVLFKTMGHDSWGLCGGRCARLHRFAGFAARRLREPWSARHMTRNVERLVYREGRRSGWWHARARSAAPAKAAHGLLHPGLPGSPNGEAGARYRDLGDPKPLDEIGRRRRADHGHDRNFKASVESTRWRDERRPCCPLPAQPNPIGRPSRLPNGTNEQPSLIAAP